MLGISKLRKADFLLIAYREKHMFSFLLKVIRKQF